MIFGNDSFGAFEDLFVDTHILWKLLPTLLEEISRPLTAYVVRECDSGDERPEKSREDYKIHVGLTSTGVRTMKTRKINMKLTVLPG